MSDDEDEQGKVKYAKQWPPDSPRNFRRYADTANLKLNYVERAEVIRRAKRLEVDGGATDEYALCTARLRMRPGHEHTITQDDTDTFVRFRHAAGYRNELVFLRPGNDSDDEADLDTTTLADPNATITVTADMTQTHTDGLTATAADVTAASGAAPGIDPGLDPEKKKKKCVVM